MYAKGWGIDQNLEEAFVWYSLAAVQPKKVARFGLNLNIAEVLEETKSKLNRLELKNATQKIKTIRKKLRL